MASGLFKIIPPAGETDAIGTWLLTPKPMLLTHLPGPEAERYNAHASRSCPAHSSCLLTCPLCLGTQTGARLPSTAVSSWQVTLVLPRSVICKLG